MLGDEFVKLNHPATSAKILGKFMITARLAKRMIILNLPAMFLMLWLLVKYFFRAGKRRRFEGRDTYLTNGNALIARLRLSLMKRRRAALAGEPRARSSSSRTAACSEPSSTKGRQRAAYSRRRRVWFVATGGFERNLEMREKYGPAPASTEWTAGNPANTGDGIVMGQKLGGDVAPDG